MSVYFLCKILRPFSKDRLRIFKDNCSFVCR